MQSFLRPSCKSGESRLSAYAHTSRALLQLRKPHESAAIAFAQELLRKEKSRKDFTVFHPSHEEHTARIAWELKQPSDGSASPATTPGRQAAASGPSAEFVYRALYPAEDAPPSDWSPEFTHLYCQTAARLMSYLGLAADTVYNDLSRDVNYRVLEYVAAVPGALRRELGLDDVSAAARRRAKRLCDAERGTSAKRLRLGRDCAELERLERALRGCA